ncbi:hypothetical protein [Bradyrhizobium genomosp. III]|uniref:hypothetical protein n=1 Tax=Bradyrhizobium genomosp. III TaxID=2683271 RepID=UPI00057746C0|nr:hypothetical protein [Bradyrhizobium sp. CCBAU 15544]
MPRQANGSYQQPANTSAVSGTSISSSAYNTLITDIGSELTNSLDRNGRSAMAAALPMGGNKITGIADPTVATDAASKNYVDTTTGAFFSTGDVKLSYKTTADTGWLMMNDGTIGNAGSGATAAGATYQALYTLLWTNISQPSSNAWCAVTGGLGVSAAADWAGLKALALPKALGRALAISGAGSGLTVRLLGANVGAESVSLGTGNLPTFTPSGTISNGSISISHNAIAGSSTTGGGGFACGGNSGASISASQGTTTFSGSSIGSGTAFSIMQPSTFLNVMIKY